MKIDVILGLQWGDEGKGKIVDYLAGNYDIIARFQGGPNAGHTLKFDGKKYVVHTIPSGIFREGMLNLIGSGVVIDPITLVKELKIVTDAGISYQNRLMVSKKAHLILPTHRYLDAASEKAKAKKKIGSTLRGIGPTYMDKTGRNGIRVGDINTDYFQQKYDALKQKHLHLLKRMPEVDFDLKTEEEKWMNSIKVLRQLIFVDGEYYINDALSTGKKILAEGAQGSMLDIDFGTYPFVTSSNTITAGVCKGLGVAPHKIGEVIGITKAYTTRVGAGPFPTELKDETGEALRQKGKEFGATTGRSRRCGWLDLVQLKYTIMINGVTQITLTKVDVLNSFKEISYARTYKIGDKITDNMPFDIVNSVVSPVYESVSGWQTDIDGIEDYEDFPLELKSFVQILEKYLQVPITIISTGPERKKIVLRKTDT